VREAKEGSQALKMVEADSPDLLLLDIWMPESTGSNPGRIKEISPSCGGHDFRARQYRARDQAAKLGAYDFIESPFPRQGPPDY